MCTCYSTIVHQALLLLMLATNTFFPRHCSSLLLFFATEIPWKPPGAAKTLYWEPINSNLCTLHSSIQVAVCFQKGWAQYLDYLKKQKKQPLNCVKLYFLLFFYPSTKKVSPKCQLYPPPQMPYLGYKCEGMTAL